MKKKAIIISIKSFVLTDKEKILLANEHPWGLILFKRNIKSLNQIKSLIKKVRKFTKDRNFPILIDEEGSAVSRLNDLINHDFSANYFGNLYSENKKLCIVLYKSYLKSLCKKLRNIGINMNTIPVLDVLRRNTNRVIGKRSFSKKKEIIKILGKITINQCKKKRLSML